MRGGAEVCRRRLPGLHSLCATGKKSVGSGQSLARNWPLGWENTSGPGSTSRSPSQSALGRGPQSSCSWGPPPSPSSGSSTSLRPLSLSSRCRDFLLSSHFCRFNCFLLSDDGGAVFLSFFCRLRSGSGSDELSFVRSMTALLDLQPEVVGTLLFILTKKTCNCTFN